MLRIIAGKYKGRKIYQPLKTVTRPMMDRVKEAIFNMIQFQIKGKIVLDLFSGSGSLAIEAISRGAIKVISVDNESAAIKIINKNIETININNIDVVQSDANDYLKDNSGKAFDLIFIDAPFKDENIESKVLKNIVQTQILKKYGLIIMQTNIKKNIIIPQGLIVKKQKKYGFCCILILANNI